MTEKRFEIIKSAIIDGARVIKDNEDKYTFATTFETATLINYRKALNELNDENEQLKQALLFFLDVANSECSSSFGKDMEHDCHKLFNCSYSEAKDKYGDYDATWWELGE